MSTKEKRRPGRSSIGLDIGSSAVRAVEVVAGRRGPVLERFGQVGLPLGAVSGGEIVDQAAVTSAVRRLWSEAGFTSRKVSLVASGQRVIVRQAQVPQMAEGDFRSALRFQAMELLPIPVEDALLDFRVLGHGGPEGAQGEMTILLAGTHREVVRQQMAALREASLQVVGVDPSPVAAVRAARRARVADVGSYAIVDIGADLTVMVVCEQDTIRFSRAVRAGGRAVTALLAQRTGVAAAAAETSKRFATAATAGDLGVAVKEVDPLIAEIEGSLGFFATQLRSGTLDRVYVTGGSSCNELLVEQLRSRLEAEVTVLDVLAGLDVSALEHAGLDPAAVGPHSLMAVGAAEGGLGSLTDRMDLLPPEVAEAAARRRATAFMAGGLAVVVLVLAGASGMRLSQIHGARTAAATLAAENATYSRQIGGLSAVSGLRRATSVRQAEAASAAQGEIDWTALQAEILRALPAGTTLSSLSLSTAAPGSASTPAAGSSSAPATGGTASPPSTAPTGPPGVGSVSMAVSSAGGEDAVAAWLRAMGTVRGLQGAWVGSASTNGAVTTFNGTATLNASAPTVVRPTAGQGRS